jgi:NADPH:quinone reductase-like Zn-dependent oxidoreductase
MKVVLPSNPKDTDSYQFDAAIKKLETTRSTRGRTNTDSSPDTSAFSNSSTASSVAKDPIFYEQRNDVTGHTLIDRGDMNSYEPQQRQTSIENFIDQQSHGHERAASTINEASLDASSQPQSNSGTKLLFPRYETLHFLDHTNPTNGVAERNLPDAILRLDRRHAIPRPRHKNDVLIEIEASTVDKRDLMTRPGVRCASTLPIGVETTCLDCIGRVVQLSTHARAIHGIEVDDRVAAIYPFEYKDEKSSNHQYTLVDAALIVIVPRNVDAAMASCMTRLYTTAFQAIQLGLTDLHDRYDLNQLQGKSLLVQDGDTELGRALIELAVELGASQIFATGPSGVHDRLRDMGATPLGAETFGWELFVEEKLSLVLVQTLPTPETFESFVSLLGTDRGMVYVQPPNNINQDDGNNVIFSDDSFDGREFLQDLANKARGAFVSAKFNCQLTCSQQFSTYEGIWANCKEDPILFKKDLRFLLTLLSEGKLNPEIEERVCLEDVPGIQDRIELEGKHGTIVCLPTTLFEKKANTVAAIKSRSRNQPTSDTEQSTSCRNSYAVDSGYVRPTYDTLSDFNFLTPKPFEDESVANPFLDQAASFTFGNNGKSGDSFISFGDSFSTWEGGFHCNDEAAIEEKDVTTEILQQHEERLDAKDKAKQEVRVGVKNEGTTAKVLTAKKEEHSATAKLNKRAQVALQRKKEMRRTKNAQQEKDQQEKSSLREINSEKKTDVEGKEETPTTPGSSGEKIVAVDVESQATKSNASTSPRQSRHEFRDRFDTTSRSDSMPKGNKVAIKSSVDAPSSCSRPATRTHRPTPEWLQGVRTQSSTTSDSMSRNHSGNFKGNARHTPEWMSGNRSQIKHSEYVASRYRFSEPPVNTIANEEGRGDDMSTASAISDFNSVMSKWKAAEKVKA